MIIMKPEKIIFETQNDIIDYVGRGLPPTKKNFRKLKEAIVDVKFQEKLPEESSTKVPGNDVIIPSHLVLDLDDETFNNILDRMYTNRVRTCKFTLGALGIIAAGLLIGKVRSSKEDNESEDCFDEVVIDEI